MECHASFVHLMKVCAMKKINGFFLLSLLLAGLQSINAQQLQHPVSLSANSGSMTGSPTKFGGMAPDSRGWTDPALNHNKLLQQQAADGNYKLIGPYKVVGSQYLFGEHHKADMFTLEAKAYNIFVSYNTYNQEVEFYSTSNPTTPLVREPGTVDSFTIHSNTELGISKNLRFIYGTALGSKDKFYYQEIFSGKKYSVYKRYKSDLGYVGTNLAQSELRQFDLQVDYYYTNNENNELKRIKPTASAVMKEFKDSKELSQVVNNDEFIANPDDSFIKVFNYLNKAVKGF